MNITKKEALKKIEELKKYVSEKEQEEKKGFVIKSWKDDSDVYISTKDNLRDAVIEAVEKGVNLSEADFRGANLSGADFREADLSGADFCGANLSEANLSEADFRGANLSEANLSEADFRGADFCGADFCGAELASAKFYGRGGTVKLKKNQVKDFLNALGFQIEE